MQCGVPSSGHPHPPPPCSSDAIFAWYCDSADALIDAVGQRHKFGPEQIVPDAMPTQSVSPAHDVVKFAGSMSMQIEESMPASFVVLASLVVGPPSSPLICPPHAADEKRATKNIKRMRGL